MWSARRKFRWTFVSGVACALSAQLCWAETAVFQEGISDANGPNESYNMDVAVLNSACSSCAGLNAEVVHYQIGGVQNESKVRALLRWDVSSLAGKGTISAARAKIVFEPVVRAEGFAVLPDELSFRLYRLAPANAGWLDAEVVWNQQKVELPWAGSGGASTPNIDYVTPEVGKVTLTGGENMTGKDVLTFEFDDIDFLQDWVNNPQNNAGFLLISEELEAAGAGESEFAQGTMFPDDIPTTSTRYPTAAPEERPILEVDFTAAVGVPGDYNGNGFVDAADYVLWRDGGPLQNDPTEGVQAEDYTFWRERFGNTSGSGAAAAVPEPNCLTFALVTCVIFFATRRSGRSRVE